MENTTYKDSQKVRERNWEADAKRLLEKQDAKEQEKQKLIADVNAQSNRQRAVDLANAPIAVASSGEDLPSGVKAKLTALEKLIANPKSTADQISNARHKLEKALGA